jgi:hypothetical protein
MKNFILVQYISLTDVPEAYMMTNENQIKILQQYYL